MTYKKISLLTILSLFLFSIYCALNIGISWDEPFHHTQGYLRTEYIKTLGNFKNYNFSSSTQFYPGLYDTVSFVLVKLLLNIFPSKYFVEIKHLVNLFFSLSALLGLFLLSKKIFNKDIAYISVILCFINPFFFGHMSMNPKDTIICFAFVWFGYFSYLYCINFGKKNYKFLLLSSLFMGFGIGTRVSFFFAVLPIVVFVLIYIFKNKSRINKFYKKFLLDSSSFIFISFVLLILAWPHVIDGGLELILETIINSINYNAGAKLGLLNGSFYETQNTPRIYLFNFLIFRIPVFILLLLMGYIYILYSNKNFFTSKFDNFNIKSFLILTCLIFPIFTAFILKVKIYDGIRLFLFLIPIVSLVCSLCLYYIIENINKTKYFKFYLFLILFSSFLFLFRFISLTPYHYDFSNYLNFNFSKTENSYEHDYWGISFRELIYTISNEKQLKNFVDYKVSLCGGDPLAVMFYLNKYIGKMRFVPADQADYILMTNRASFNINDKSTCYSKYKGTDIVTVKRLNLNLSKLKKIEK